MIRVLIVDDEPPARRKVRRFLEGDAEIGEIRDAAAGTEAIGAIQRYHPDLVFLDVQMPDMDGFAVLDAVPEPHDFHVVFLTAHDQHALRAFEAEALDYLLKPVDPERFERALERAKDQVALRRERQPKAEPRFLKRIVVEKNHREILLPVERIDWAEADRNYVCLHSNGETYTIRGTLEGLARQLDPDQFTRISRSELVNLDRIKEMQPWFHGERRIVLQDGRELTWTRRFRAQTSQRLSPLVPPLLPISARAARMRSMRCLILALSFAMVASAADNDWTAYGRDAGGTRYSPLKQVTRDNVSKLKVAWTYHTGALKPETARNEKAAFEATPILIDGVLYLSTPFNQVIALDPANGVEKWKFDPNVDRSHDYSEVSSRGVAAWTDSKAAPGAACRLRIFEGTIDARLIALDGSTGKPCADFGKDGQVELWHGVVYGPEFRGDYEVTSAPTVVGDLVITGSSIGDNGAVDMPRGVVRGYDTRTGALRWTWDPIPWANKQQVRTGAANAWSTFVADPARDLVFIPTGSASPDYYGGTRPGDNKWANSVVALKASTGALVWGFQVAHHDLWDYDVASQPSLIDFRGKPAVAVTTKIGHVFVLDRVTGKPLNTVEERAVPKSDVPGEDAAPSQPIPAWSAMVPQKLTAADAWGPTPEMRKWCQDRIASYRNDGLFTPPSYKGTISFPGNIGGVNWGSAAWDPVRNVLLANTNRVAAIMRLIPREDMLAALAHPDEMAWGGEFARQRGTPYGMFRDWLVSPSGLPCNAPPWGALVAFDLNTGKLRWEAPLGSMGEGAPAGSISLGGPMATAGGLVFSAAARDPHLHAFDADTGKEVWTVELPASAQSTPMTYEWRGKQYIVICAGGHGKMKSKMGDAVVAFTLE